MMCKVNIVVLYAPEVLSVYIKMLVKMEKTFWTYSTYVLLVYRTAYPLLLELRLLHQHHLHLQSLQYMVD